MPILFFKNFPHHLTEAEISALFAQYGEVESVAFIPSKTTGEKVGMGLVTMADEAGAVAALERFRELNGKKVIVDRSKPPDPTKEFARALNETKGDAIDTLRVIIQTLGSDFAQRMLDETLAVEAQGGLMVPDGSRRRTMGGVFFYLVRQQLSPEQQTIIFPSDRHRKKRQAQPATPPPTPAPALPPFHWQDRLAILTPLLIAKGQATTMKVTLIGRPGQIEKRQNLVILAMEHTIHKVAFPKGVPTPPDTPTLYTVYIAGKQWNTVEAALEDPHDALVIEGQGAFDPAIQGMAVFATNVTTKIMQQNKRPKEASPTPAAPIQAESPAQPPMDAQSRLVDLRQALQTAQQKLATNSDKTAMFAASQAIFKLESDIKALLQAHPELK